MGRPPGLHGPLDADVMRHLPLRTRSRHTSRFLGQELTDMLCDDISVFLDGKMSRI
jgi:hypothetical protein